MAKERLLALLIRLLINATYRQKVIGVKAGYIAGWLLPARYWLRYYCRHSITGTVWSHRH